MSKKNLYVLGAVLALFLAVPLTIFVLQFQQENRSRAQKATVLYFNTKTSSPSPILSLKPGETFSLDLYMDPGANFVSNIRYTFSYDPAVFAPIPANYSYNKDVFPTDPKKANLEGPNFVPSGQVSGLLTIGNNPSNAITDSIKVASFSFLVTSDISKLQSPTIVKFVTESNQTAVTSVDPQSTGSENVLSSALDANIAFVLPTGQITNTQILGCANFPTCQVQVDWTTQNASNVLLKIGNNNSVPVSPSGSYANFFSVATPLPVYLYDGTTLLDQATITNTLTPTPSTTGTPIPTQTPVPTTTPFPTSTPTPTPTAIPTPTPTSTSGQVAAFNLNLALHGIGSSGDNRNDASTLSNKNPLTPTRSITVGFYNPLTDQKVFDKTGTVTYDDESGTFKGSLAFLNNMPGQYKLKVKTDRYLIRTAATNITIPVNAAANITVPNMSLVSGDVNTDNRLSILDYNLLMDCYSDFAPAKACDDMTQKSMSDLTDDGSVNQTDYNLFIRELSVQYGE